MRRLLCLLAISVVVASSSMAFASGPELFGSSFFYSAAIAPAPAPDGAKLVPVPAAGGAVAQYPCVKVRDSQNIAPCAVKKIIQIVDPCWKPNPCGCCAPAKPRCVSVEICVPRPKPVSCCRPKKQVCKVTCSKNGRHVRYDYGSYAVDIRSKNGYVEVDYDD